MPLVINRLPVAIWRVVVRWLMLFPTTPETEVRMNSQREGEQYIRLNFLLTVVVSTIRPNPSAARELISVTSRLARIHIATGIVVEAQPFGKGDIGMNPGDITFLICSGHIVIGRPEG